MMRVFPNIIGHGLWLMRNAGVGTVRSGVDGAVGMATIQSVCAWWVFEKGVCDFLQRVVFITRRMNHSEAYMGNPYNVCRIQKYRDCVAAMLSSARVDSSMLYVLRGQPAGLLNRRVGRLPRLFITPKSKSSWGKAPTLILFQVFHGLLYPLVRTRVVQQRR